MPQVGDIEASALVVRGLTELKGESVAQIATYIVAGAITEKSGVVALGSAGALTMTLADPIEGTDDGKKLTIVAITAQAHKVSNVAGSGINGGGGAVDFLNFAAAIGNSCILVAHGGVWHAVNLLNVTIAGT